MASSTSTPADALPVDVLVIGGGIQGLLVLKRLTADGVSCALVTSGDLGTGQTLHSHGVLNTGFGMVGPEPVRILRDLARPELARLGVSTYGEWAAVLPPGSQPADPAPAAAGLEPLQARMQRLVEVNVDRRELVTALARGVEGRIVRGSVSAVQRDGDGRIVAVEVAGCGGPGSAVFAPGAVVVAAGAGSKALLRRLGADEAQITALTHRLVHVLCVRARQSVLPMLNVVSFADQLFVASYGSGGETTWLATPMQLDAPAVDGVPDDASADVDEGVAERGWETLFRLYPALGSLPGLRFTCYAGFRQDIGDSPGVPWCDRIAAVPNAVAALPSGLLGAWPVAARAAGLARETVREHVPQPAIAVAAGVRVGGVHEDGAGMTWAEHPAAGSRTRYTSGGAAGRA